MRATRCELRPDSFRFADDNPCIGLPMAQSRFADLPDYAADVVLNMGVSPQQWNALVEDGRVLEVAALDGWHRLPRRRDWRKAPSRSGWPGAARRGEAVA